MPITPNRVTTEYIMDLNTENFLSLSDTSKILDKAKNAIKSAHETAMDTLGGNKDGSIELLDPKGPLGKLLGNVAKSRSNLDNILGLFDNVICKGGQFTFDINLSLFLSNLLRGLKFNFDPKLCGFSLKRNPMDAIMKVASNFDPLAINIGINGDPFIVKAIEKTLNPYLDRLPNYLKNIIKLNTDGSVPKLRNPYGAPITSKGSFKIYLTKKEPLPDKLSKYDWRAWLSQQSHKNAFDIIASNHTTELRPYMWDIWSYGSEEYKMIILKAVRLSCLDKNVLTKLKAYNSLNELDETPTAQQKAIISSSKDDILKTFKKDKPTTNQNYDDTISLLNTTLPNWNYENNNKSFIHVANNPTMGSLAKNKSKSILATTPTDGIVNKKIQDHETINILNTFNSGQRPSKIKGNTLKAS